MRANADTGTVTDMLGARSQMLRCLVELGGSLLVLCGYTLRAGIIHRQAS